MIRPSRLYDLAANCFQCHVLARNVDRLEEMVNTEARGGGHHEASSLDFELLAWSHGEVRHNFRGAGGASEPSNPEAELRRSLFIVGQMLDTEYTLRAIANSTDPNGRYFTSIRSRLTGGDGRPGTLARLEQIRDALGGHEVGQRVARVLDAVDLDQVRPNNREALMTMARRVQIEALFFNEKSPEELHALDEELTGIDGFLPGASDYQGTVPTFE
jgi:hypothetical protein